MTQQLLTIFALLFPIIHLAAQPFEGWELSGGAVVEQAHGVTALKLPPGSKAVLPLRTEDGAGSVTIRIYDDGSNPEAVKKKAAGPVWGLQSADGRVMGTGFLYAPYLGGDKAFATTEFLAPKEDPLSRVQYVGIKRKTGWQDWRFDMDATQGLKIFRDDQAVTRYDWNKSQFKGFNAVVLQGGKTGQTLWVESVATELGGKMVAAPKPPPPPPPVVPDADPMEKEGVAILPEVMAQHPRILFGPEDVARLRENAKHPDNAKNLADLNEYLGASKAPDHTTFLKDATDGQRQGLWRMPTLGMYYVLTGDPGALAEGEKFLRHLLALENWETTKERDSGMSSANIMIGAAILFDWMYNDLDPQLRSDFRAKLWEMARRQYHGGHLKKNPGPHYWQNDPANNHRWHRNAGMALAAFTAATGAPEEQWLLNRIDEDLAYVAKWLPPDGTSHESPSYLTFGLPHLTLAMQASDRCLGTGYLDQDFFKYAPDYKLHSVTPDFATAFHYGDSGGTGMYNHPLWLYTAHHKLAELQTGLEKVQEVNPRAFLYGWMALLWKDPTLPDTDLARLPTTRYFPDIGTVFVRDKWADDGVAAMFKACPFGGFELNKFRNQNNYAYINVAHDDPDANSFTVYANGNFVVETDRYSKHKKSANHNTILVNGKGQMAKGRPEGKVWSQPATGNTDMTDMAYITGWKDEGDVVIIEGEAAGSYAELNRYRRTFVWVKGEYLLVLDDIRGKDSPEITWLLQAPKLEVRGDGHYLLTHSSAECPVQVTASRPFGEEVKESSADDRGQPLGWQQLHLRFKEGTDSLQVVSLLQPWGGRRKVSTSSGPQGMQISVDGDTWQWAPAAAERVPSSLKGRGTLTPEDLPPEI